MLAPNGSVAWKSLSAPATPVIVMIGPEGGWEDGEMQAAAMVGFKSMQLGRRVLRTETAGIAILAAMQAIWGDF